MRIPILACTLLLTAALRAQSTFPADRLPIPDAKSLAHAKDLVHTLYKDDFAKTTPSDLDSLAQRLLTEAAATKDDPAARYDLLLESTELATQCVDMDTAMKAADTLAATYTINPIDLHLQTLRRASAAATTPRQFQNLALAAITFAEAAAKDDDTATASQAAAITETAALHSESVVLSSSLQLRLGVIRDLADEFGTVRLALKKLEKNPNDPDAHLTIGRYYALHKGQFVDGLPHLAAGSDPTLRDLALTDLSNPIDPNKQLALADAWWDYAQKSDGSARLNVSQHARQWYALAKNSLTGITLTRIQSRLQGDSTSVIPTPDAPNTATSVNLLPLIDTTKDAAQGQWSLTSAGLTCTNSKYATLALPYLLPDEYDLKIAFTRIEGAGPICVLLASGKKSFGFELDVKGEARFERVAGKIAKDNPTTVAATLSNNHPYALTLQIRHDSITALLDGKPLTQYKTDYKDLSRYALWKLPNESLSGLGANNAKVTFQHIEITPITGTGKPLR